MQTVAHGHRLFPSRHRRRGWKYLQPLFSHPSLQSLAAGGRDRVSREGVRKLEVKRRKQKVFSSFSISTFMSHSRLSFPSAPLPVFGACYCFLFVCFCSLETRAGNCVIYVGYSTLFSSTGILSSFLLLHRKERRGEGMKRETEREPRGTKTVIKCSSIEATTIPKDREEKV